MLVRSKAPERGSRSNSPALEKAPLGLFRRAELALCPPQGPSSCSAFLAFLITVLNGEEDFISDRSSRLGGGQSLKQSCFGKRATGTFSSCGTRFVPPSQSPRPLLPRSRRLSAQGPSSCSAFLALLVTVLNGGERCNLTGQKARTGDNCSESTGFGKSPTGTFSSCGTRFVPPSQSPRPLLPRSKRLSAQGPSSCSAFLALLINVLNGGEGKRAARLARPGEAFDSLHSLCNFPFDQHSSGRACLGSQFDAISNGVAA